MNLITPPAFGTLSTDKYAAVNDCVQLDVYSSTGLFLETIPRATDYSINGLSLSIDLESELKKANYVAGDFEITARLVRNLLGSVDGLKMAIQDISANRLEVRVQPQLLTANSTNNIQTIASTNQQIIDWFGTKIFEYTKQDLLSNLFLYKTTINKVSVFDYIQDKITIEYEPWSIIFKLTSALPVDISIGDLVWFGQEVATPITEKVRIIPSGIGTNLIQLKGPNYNANATANSQVATDYKDWDDLLGSTNQAKVISSVFSGSLVEGVDLNIDYRQFENFIFYGSAYERIKNFEYKVSLVEYYDSIISSLSTGLFGLSNSSTSGSAVFVSQSLSYEQKKQALLGSFDGFERYMYYASSSYISNSFGEFLDMAWPKTGSLTAAGTLAKPYTLMPTTSSYVMDWMDGLLASASVYDQNNPNAIIKLLPAHIRESGDNTSAETYVQMIGHYFDIVRSYAGQMTRMYSRDESLTEGLAKDLVYTIGENLGLDFDNGSSLKDLWAYTLGLDVSGSAVNTGSFNSYNDQLQTTAEDYTKEIWKRVLNNLPLLLRTKGTARGVRALINCFGIPRTILRIKEYGGPEPEFDTVSTSNFERFSYGLRVGYVSGSTTKRSYLQTNWLPLSQSRTIQLRIKPDPATRSTNYVPIFEISNKFLIALQQTGSVDRIHFIGSSSAGTWDGFYIEPTASIGNIYDGNWTNLSFTFTPNATGFDGIGYAKRVQYGKVITALGSGSFGIPQSSSLLGPYSTTPVIHIPGTASYTNLNTSPYYGQVQEFRLWSCSLNEQTINKHALAPTSYMSNVTGAFAGNTSSYDDLLFRLTLGSAAKKINYQLTSSYKSQHPNQTIARSASFYNFTTSSYTSSVENYYLEWPDLGTNREIGNKIRIDSLVQPVDTVYRNVRIEQPISDLYPSDSPRLGVFLSPTNEINEDIAEQFGGISIDDYIGDPSNINKNSYDNLKDLRRVYLKKYQTGSLTSWSGYNAQRYVDLLRYYDNSLFRLIKSFVPEKADIQTGLVIESDILFRNKFKGITIEQPENPTYETTIILPETSTIAGFVQDAVGEKANHPNYVFGVETNAPITTTVSSVYSKQHEGVVDGKNNITFDNSVQPTKYFTTNDSLKTTVTSYGLNTKERGSQYRFYTWDKTGSGAFDFAWVDALPESYWNPLGPCIIGSRLSENYNTGLFPYNGDDILLGSGSFNNYPINVYYTGSSLLGLEVERGFVFTPRPMVAGASNYWVHNDNTSDDLQYIAGGSTTPGTVTVPIPSDSDTTEVSFTVLRTGAATWTVDVTVGGSTSTTTVSTSTTIPISFRAQTSGSTTITISLTPSATGGYILLDDLIIRTYKAAQIQDFHVGEFANTGMKNARYDGSKLTSIGYNIDSPDTVDGGPVITILQSNPNDLTVKPIAINKKATQQSTKGGTFQIS